MEPREVYLRAAELVAAGKHTFPCTAVYSADPQHMNWHREDSLTRQFILTMAPSVTGFHTPQAASSAYLLKLWHGLKDHSVLALCFMAAIAETAE